ncbi:protein ARV1 [Anthonomus grandis grandis]|uniref:protein ARV1 n=1 Tax=Anthonomus grandis grandis TaxID=2921223 RepID=UPI002165957F|nr:protein ARV1 [Anthonomus grandis grandis]
MLKSNLNFYYCIHCGEKTQTLFKKYSETVLKLTECKNCGKTADKYVEYDIVIIIIDLILLKNIAYRHLLLNTEFKNFWKLAVILMLLESYCDSALSTRLLTNVYEKQANKTEPTLSDFDMNIEDLKFYIMCLNTALSHFTFVLTIYMLTIIYGKIKRWDDMPTLCLIMKTMTLASTGAFLQLPSIIWDLSLYSHHLHFITVYTCLSQLLAYRVICYSPKMWCLFVVFASHLIKYNVSSHLGTFINFIFTQHMDQNNLIF